ncbi:MAG: hypothetical protein U0R19_37010 [Bryobacteraceae bacterium]
MRTLLLAIASLIIAASAAVAGPVTYDLVGDPDVSGFVTFNLPAGVGLTNVSNSNVTALSIVVGGESFSLGDVLTGDSTEFDFGVDPPAIVNGGGSLATNGSAYLTLFAGFDGDARILTNLHFYEVQWVARDGSEVPEPATLTVVIAVLAGLALLRRMRST